MTRIRSTEDAVAVIAAYTTKAIAAGGHPGHDLESVGEVMTLDAVLDAIRASYTRHIRNGKTPKDAVIATGCAVVAHYCNRAGIPTSR